RLWRSLPSSLWSTWRAVVRPHLLSLVTSLGSPHLHAALLPFLKLPSLFLSRSRGGRHRAVRALTAQLQRPAPAFPTPPPPAPSPPARSSSPPALVSRVRRASSLLC